MTPLIALNISVSPNNFFEPFSFPPYGKSVVSSRVYKICPITVLHRVTFVDLTKLEMIDFDIILGMDYVNS